MLVEFYILSRYTFSFNKINQNIYVVACLGPVVDVQFKIDCVSIFRWSRDLDGLYDIH